MLATRITPKLVMGACAFTIGLAWMARRAPQCGAMSGQALAAHALSLAALLAAGLACWLCLVIAAEHRQAPKIQWAWRLLAANSALWVARAALESLWVKGLLADEPLRLLLVQTVVFPANLCLLLGCIAMWLAFHAVGLPVRLQPGDWLLIGLFIALSVLLLSVRAGFGEAVSPYWFARYAQPFGIPVFAAYGVLSVILSRMAVEMGGGKLALALRCLTLYMLLRAVSWLLVSAYAVLKEPYGLHEFGEAVRLFNDTAAPIVRWLPALAASYRLQMSVQASRKLRHLRESQPAPVVPQPVEVAAGRD